MGVLLKPQFDFYDPSQEIENPPIGDYEIWSVFDEAWVSTVPVSLEKGQEKEILFLQPRFNIRGLPTRISEKMNAQCEVLGAD